MINIYKFNEYVNYKKIFKIIDKSTFDELLNLNCYNFNQLKLNFYYKFNSSDDYIFVDITDKDELNNFYMWLINNSTDWKKYPNISEYSFFNTYNLTQKEGNLYQLYLYDLNLNKEITKIGISPKLRFIDSFQKGINDLFGKSFMSLEDFNKIFYEIYKNCYNNIPQNNIEFISSLKNLTNKLNNCNLNNTLVYNMNKYLEINKNINSQTEIITITKLLNPELNEIKYVELKEGLKIKTRNELWSDSNFLLKRIK